MSSVELRSEHTTQSDRGDVPPLVARDRDNIKSPMRVAPILITLGTVAAAVLLTWATWQTYMGAPWTRDATVRAYVVTMAPEVAGRIVKLPIADDQFVHKGDELFEIEPADYRIALEQAQAQAQRDGAALDYARKNATGKPLSPRKAGPQRMSTSKRQARYVNPRASSRWTRPPSPRRSSISA